METLLKEQYNEIECPHCKKVILVLKERKLVKEVANTVKQRRVSRTNVRWSLDEDRTLQEQTNLGTKTREIARMLGRTLASVYVRKDKLNKASKAAESEDEE